MSHQMALPNLLGHESPTEVVAQSRIWDRYRDEMLSCHPDARDYLCSLFAPVCIPNPMKHNKEYMELQPCHGLCTSVRDTCRQKLKFSAYNPSEEVWQTMFNCDRFPVERGLCVGPRKHTTTVNNNSLQEQSRKPATPVSVVKPDFSPSRKKITKPITQKRNQCSVCQFSASSSEIRSFVCDQNTHFIVKIKSAKVQLIKRTSKIYFKNRNYQNGKNRPTLKVAYYWRIQGQPRVLKGGRLPNKKKTYFYLQKPRSSCSCDMLYDKKNRDFVVFGRYQVDKTPIISVIQPFKSWGLVKFAYQYFDCNSNF